MACFFFLFSFFKLDIFKDWRDSSVIKSTVCCSRGPGFNHQYQQGDSLPPVIPVSRSDKFFWLPQTPGANSVHRCTCRQTLTHRINKNVHFRLYLCVCPQTLVHTCTRVQVHVREPHVSAHGGQKRVSDPRKPHTGSSEIPDMGDGKGIWVLSKNY